jgi:hypothetical protein
MDRRTRIAIERLQAGAQELTMAYIPIRDADLTDLMEALRINATLTTLKLTSNNLGVEGARALAATLNTTKITSLYLRWNRIGDEGARSLAAALNATLTSLDLSCNNIGPVGARALASALNTTCITSLCLTRNNIGDEGARSLAAALDNNSTLTRLDLAFNNIGDEGARLLAAALNATLTSLDLGFNDIGADIQNLVVDRLRVNKLVPKVALWVASAVMRRVELWDDIHVLPPAVAARAAVLAFGYELLDLQLPDDRNNNNLWRSPGGRDLAAVYLLPRAETALCRELQRLADAASRAR